MHKKVDQQLSTCCIDPWWAFHKDKKWDETATVTVRQICWCLYIDFAFISNDNNQGVCNLTNGFQVQWLLATFCPSYYEACMTKSSDPVFFEMSQRVTKCFPAWGARAEIQVGKAFLLHSHEAIQPSHHTHCLWCRFAFQATLCWWLSTLCFCNTTSSDLHLLWDFDHHNLCTTTQFLNRCTNEQHSGGCSSGSPRMWHKRNDGTARKMPALFPSKLVTQHPKVLLRVQRAWCFPMSFCTRWN